MAMRRKVRPTSELVLVVVAGVMLLASAAAVPGAAAPESAPPGAQAQPAAGAPAAEGGRHVVRALYFHTTKRCVSCRKIEAFASEAIRGGFPAEIKEGTLTLELLNVEEPQNRHFIQDYQLYTKSLVLIDTVGGKQVRWKNLARVWELLGDQQAFVRYVQDEVRGYLERSP